MDTKTIIIVAVSLLAICAIVYYFRRSSSNLSTIFNKQHTMQELIDTSLCNSSNVGSLPGYAGPKYCSLARELLNDYINCSQNPHGEYCLKGLNPIIMSDEAFLSNLPTICQKTGHQDINKCVVYYTNMYNNPRNVENNSPLLRRLNTLAEVDNISRKCVGQTDPSCYAKFYITNMMSPR